VHPPPRGPAAQEPQEEPTGHAMTAMSDDDAAAFAGSHGDRGRPQITLYK
jgi:hypothetical protein